MLNIFPIEDVGETDALTNGEYIRFEPFEFIDSIVYYQTVSDTFCNTWLRIKNRSFKEKFGLYILLNEVSSDIIIENNERKFSKKNSVIIY